jgi:hypothetical protein
MSCFVVTATRESIGDDIPVPWQMLDPERVVLQLLDCEGAEPSNTARETENVERSKSTRITQAIPK